MNKTLLIFNTVKHLKLIQIYYQVGYRLRESLRNAIGFRYPFTKEATPTPLQLEAWIDKPVSCDKGVFFTFLNQTLENPSYKDKTLGPLWRYNFNYMDYLLQPGMIKENGLAMIQQYIKEFPENNIGTDPYTISLRGINWIKFFIKFAADNQDIAKVLCAHYQILYDKIEYHLLANHLLENGFGLLYGAFYFRDYRLYKKAKAILETELDEQILADGAHFELSPMYHQILLDRLLDCINLLQNNDRFEGQTELLDKMQVKAQKMLSWLNTMTFSNGEIPLLNDAAPGISPDTVQLNTYARSLKLVIGNADEGRNMPLSSSGYRKFTSPSYECIIDIGAIGPSYQPGHAHADTFNFVLNVANKPAIVDAGISTYDAGVARLRERGTAAHNTVTVNGRNSSEVWSSFRVACRAEVEVMKDGEKTVVARHNGYRKLKTTHQREWFFSDSRIEITDTLFGKVTNGIVHFWFAPGQQPVQKENEIETNDYRIHFSKGSRVNLMSVSIPNGYNRFSNSYKVEVLFTDQVESLITIK